MLRMEKRHARDKDGDMPVSRKRIGVRLFFARSHLVRRKKAEPFRGEERRGGGWVGRRRQKPGIYTNPVGQKQFSVVSSVVLFPSKGFFSLAATTSSRSRKGEGTRARGHSWKNKSLHEFLEHRHGWSSLTLARRSCFAWPRLMSPGSGVFPPPIVDTGFCGHVCCAKGPRNRCLPILERSREEGRRRYSRDHSFSSRAGRSFRRDAFVRDFVPMLRIRERSNE